MGIDSLNARFIIEFFQLESCIKTMKTTTGQKPSDSKTNLAVSSKKNSLKKAASWFAHNLRQVEKGRRYRQGLERENSM